MQEYYMFILLSLSVVFLHIQVVVSQNAPSWTDVSGIARTPDGRFKGFSESTPKGTIVARVQAVDPQNGPIKYTMGGDAATNLEIDETSGEIKLVAPFDFEKQSVELSIIVRATDIEGLSVTFETSISVFDANDNSPVFTNPDTGSTYFNANPPENTPVNTTIFNITVNDVDYAQPPLIVTCDRNTAERARACDVFRLVVTENSNRYWRGRLVLQQPLDYETEQSYTVRVFANDSVNSRPQELQVGIRDVNDSPPRFTRAIGVVLPENQPVGTFIEQVIAEDTDTTEKRTIFYELYGNNESLRYFTVNSTTGIVTNRIALDYEDPARVPGQRFLLDFRAREILQAGSPPTLGNDSVTTATAQISVLITDINDNCPLFDQSAYRVEIQENIPQGSNIPLQMTVTDRDSGDRASFNLNLQPFSNTFGVRPTFGSSPASITIAVINSTALDYESSQTSYSLTVQAIPSTGQPASCPSSQASVLILLKDVNDNYPTFTQTDYSATVREDATGGTSVITVTAVDRDSEYMGQAGLVYSLSNDGSNLFDIDARGYITVKSCSDPGPGRYRCIDYEAQTRYDLTVRAVDNRGVSPFLAGSAPLTIHIMDVNDNEPQLLQSYIRYIREGETHTTDRLQLQAVDRDSNVLTYSILPNQPDATLWTINATADIYATRPIVYSDLVNLERGSFVFQVQASDGTYTATATVTIFVIDVNDKVPYCFPEAIQTTIPESMSANTVVTQLRVTDKDSPATGNGMVDVSIDDGSLGKFVVQPNGTESNNQYFFNIITSPDATFDYDIKNTYLLLVKVRDRGSPSNTGTCYVTINVRDDNNKNPYIDPPSQSVAVSENTPIGTSVFDVTARDVDVGAVLRFRFGPKQVCYKSGQQVPFRELFEMDENGRVTVKNKLDRDIVDFLSYDIIVNDTSAIGLLQEGQGVLYIRILEYNDQNPQFERSFYNFSILEERPLASFVGSLVATDEDDQIASYLLIDNPGDLFAVGLNSGVLRVNGRLDYEKQHNVTLTAQALDTGSPSLGAQTTVFINIININDNTPVFGQLVYQIHVLENAYLSGEVLRVSATDLDEEDYGVVRYSLNDPYFNINNITGAISMVSTDVKLDRESQALYTFLVVAYDSPNHPSERLSSTVPVYVIVDDANDNCPEFIQGTVFSGNVIETADVGDQVIEIYASDKDTGTNADIVFSIENSSLVPMFEIKTFRSTNDNTRSGRVLVKESLRKRPGVYNFTVVASDMGGSGSPMMCSSRATVIITVQEAINDAPVWIRPPISNYSIEVLESQYRGMLVYDCKASDINPGDRGIIDYSFNVRQQLVQNTAEFRVNPVTCIIRAEIVFDREQVDTYALTLVAKDRGDPSARSETVLIVRVLDVNDNYPEFPMINGETIPYSFRVPEGVNTTTAGIIGKVSASDKDSTNPNNVVFYKILAGNDDGWFILNRTSGEISLNPNVARQGLDREKTGSYTMDILAYNDVNDDSVIRNRRRRSTNPSIVTVNIEVTDVNDTPPSFTSLQYYGCISLDARYGQSIVTVQALDADIDRAPVIWYTKISETTTGNFFSVDLNTGIVRNSRLLYEIQSRTPSLIVQADDNGDLSNNNGSIALTKVQIFVTSTDDEVVLQVNQPASDVRSYQEQIKRVIMNSSSTANPISHVCIREIANSVQDGDQQAYTSSDVYVSAIGPRDQNYFIYPGSVLRDMLQQQLKDVKTAPAYQSLYVESIKSREEDGGILALFKEDAVIAIFIICIVLLFLAIILIILACMFIKFSSQRKKRKLNAERNTFVEFAQEEPPQPLHSVNPVYALKAPAPAYQEPPSDIYSVVQKPPKTMETFGSVPVTPVVVSSYSLDPPDMPEAEPVIITEPIMSEEIPVTRQPPPADFFDPVPVIETEVVSDNDDDDDDDDDSEPGYTDQIGDIIDAEIQYEDDDESPQSSPRSRPSSPDEYRIETNIV